MRLYKFIQVNIFKGKYLSALLEFLESENPDFISMQEVTTGFLNNCDDKTLNLFECIKDKLGYEGVYNGDLKLKDSSDSFGNAVLSRFPVLDSKIVVLHEFRPLSIEEVDHEPRIWVKMPRHVLDLIVDIGGLKIHAMSWHGAWTAPPEDTEETIGQAQKVADYLTNLGEPFILGCDMNAIVQSKAVEIVSGAANNLMLGSGIIQTTHPKIHKIAPRGYLIDYVFASSGFLLKSLNVPLVTVSDHLPVVVELEL